MVAFFGFARMFGVVNFNRPKTWLFAVAFFFSSGFAWAVAPTCGRMARNPTTGELDCVGVILDTTGGTPGDCVLWNGSNFYLAACSGGPVNNFLLLEDATFFLLEDATKLILE